MAICGEGCVCKCKRMGSEQYGDFMFSLSNMFKCGMGEREYMKRCPVAVQERLKICQHF